MTDVSIYDKLLAIIAHDIEEMQYMMRKLVEEHNSLDLTVNLDSSKYFCVVGQPNNLTLEDGKEIL